ncbi:transcription initiation factor iie alpha subunit [Anaeramoeba flamelloides]|uniref:Transcription initiation factor iie alpha subunit n=1 Tax=Anaeramoeba flamelloides TaxID=1746091 RepID=A0AAV7ZQB6_9EUKA|nr:transcription initiation factor iie alpha subunit [Anaeramoeba flamelloides]
MTANEIALLLKINHKKIRKELAFLANEKNQLLQKKTQTETKIKEYDDNNQEIIKTNETHKTQKTLYYIDFKHFVDITLYKIHQMKNILEKRAKEEVNSSEYVCTKCNDKYSTNAALELLDYSLGYMVCEYCGGKLKQAELTKEESSQLQLDIFKKEIQPLISYLEDTRNFYIVEGQEDNRFSILSKDEYAIQEDKIRNQSNNFNNRRGGNRGINMDGERHFYLAEFPNRQVNVTIMNEKSMLDFSNQLGIFEGDSDEIRNQKSMPPWLKDSYQISTLQKQKIDLLDLKKFGYMANEKDEEKLVRKRIKKRKDTNKEISSIKSFSNFLQDQNKTHKKRRTKLINNVGQSNTENVQLMSQNIIIEKENQQQRGGQGQEMVEEPDQSLVNNVTTLINGKPVPIIDITDELIEQMTEKEFLNYYELVKKIRDKKLNLIFLSNQDEF